ncbi:MAG: hypothetical protein IMZ62_01310 [Chloroflexi bacterium]|nr:hypothetical protein [Chloroflexota bacterium]
MHNRLKEFSRKLHRSLFRRGWLSSRVESDPLVSHLREAIAASRQRQNSPFRLEAGEDEERERQYRLTWVLENRPLVYGFCVLIGAVGFCVCGLQPKDVQYFNVIPTFLTSVIAIGLPLVTAFGVLRRTGRWAEEYLFRATHLGWFTLTTGISACAGLVSIAVAPLSCLSACTPALAGLVWGLAIATLLYLTAVVLEIIFCSQRPDFACAASANVLSERLLEGLLRNAYIGRLLSKPAQPLCVKAKWFRLRPDFCADWPKHAQEDLRHLFLYEASSRLAEFDTRGYRLHLRAVTSAVSEFAKLWADPKFRQLSSTDREASGEQAGGQEASFETVHRLLWLYPRLLDQVLYHEAQVERTPYLETTRFVRCHQDAYRDILKECVRRGNAEMFAVLLEQLPHFYNRIVRFCHPDDGLSPAARESLNDLSSLRATWGLVYMWLQSFLSDLPASLDPATRWRFLLFLHRAACVWIRRAKQKTDESLVDNLAEAIANVMETDHAWRKVHKVPAEEADLLMARHWLILGESLSEVLSVQANTWKDLPDNLTPKFLQGQEPATLLRFYDFHRGVCEFDRGFEDLSQDLPTQRHLLAGVGVGPAQSVGSHEEEMRLAFLWLLLNRPERVQSLPPIPVDVSSPAIRKDLARIIGMFPGRPGSQRIWEMPGGGEKHWIEEWLERCTAKQGTKKRQEVADASIDNGMVQTFREEFQEAFRLNLALVRFLLDVHAYEVDEGTQPFVTKTLVPKTAVIAPSLGYDDTLGKALGRVYGRGLDTEFARTLSSVAEEGSEPPSNYETAITKAAAWLEGKGCTGNAGIILVLGRAHVRSLFADSDVFVPAWKEAAGIQGFEGRYRGFPVWERQLDRHSQVLAVDLRDARPLRVPRRALDGSWVDVSVREISADELTGIKKDCEDGKKSVDELHQRQNCVADIAVHAQFVPPEKSQLLAIAVQQADGDTEEGSAQGENQTGGEDAKSK